MKKILVLLLAAALLVATGCAGTGTEAGKADKKAIARLRAELQKIDGKLLNEEKPDEEALLKQKKEALKALGEEYLKNDDRTEYSKADDVFEDAIYVYEELPKLIDIEKEGKEPMIGRLGRYIRRNIQILFLQGRYEKSYELAKKMYEIEPVNAGNQNLYVDSAANLAQKAFDKGDFEQAQKYAREGAAVRYDKKSLELLGKSILKLAEKAVEDGDSEKAEGLLAIAPPLDDAEYNQKLQELSKEVKGLTGN